MILNTGDDKLFLLMHSMDICVSVCAHYMIGTILDSEVSASLDRAVKKIQSSPSWSLHSREETNNNKQMKNTEYIRR